MRQAILQSNFTAGEISPRLKGRVDFDKYFNTAETLKNVIVQTHGGVFRRTGTRFVAEVKNSAKKVRLIRFEFSLTQAYILEFGDQYMRVFKDQGQVTSGGSPYEISTPYLEADLFEIQFVQSADVLYLAHPSYKPRKISRTGHTAWTLSNFAPTADPFGNCTGDRGPSACGLLGFGLADSLYADHVIVVTDNLVDFPCVPWQIQGNNVDHVVVLDKIGEPEKIVSGTTRLTKSPDRLYIAELTAKFVRDSGIMKDGFSFQAGAGGTALAFAIYLREFMKEENIKARFIRAGSTKYLVEMLEEGLTDYILDGQTFDLEGVRSMRENSGHINTSPFTSYNWHGKGNFASILDAVVLGATEVDLNFNANVVTHSDGKMLHGIGGWQNCLFSKCTILPIPSFRNRIPIIVDKVTTLVGPGELIDVIVTERGIAINPKRKDLIKATKNSGLPIRKIEEIKQEVDNLVGAPMDKPKFTDEIVGVVKWVDGTIIDSIFKTESI